MASAEPLKHYDLESRGLPPDGFMMSAREYGACCERVRAILSTTLRALAQPLGKLASVLIGDFVRTATKRVSR
jgi:zinc transporter ZupT